MCLLKTASWFLWDLSTQAWWLSELSVFRTCPLGGSLKSWNPRRAVQTLHSSGEAENWIYHPNCMVLCRVESIGWWASPFLPILVWGVSWLSDVCVTELVFGFLSEEITPCIAVPQCIRGRREVQGPPVSSSWSHTKNWHIHCSKQDYASG